MTNEEKAKEIANLCDVCIEYDYPCPGCSECEARGSYYGAVEMAKYKDHQFIEILEKLQEERFAESDKHADWLALQEVINDLKMSNK